MWIRRRAVGVSSAAASEGGTSSAAWTEMGSWMRTFGGKLKQRLRLDVGREICRQYPLFCFLLLCLSAASLLLNRYLPLAPRRPLGSPWAMLGCGLRAAGGRREPTLHSRLGSDGRGRARMCGRAPAGCRGPGIFRGYQALNLSFLTLSQNVGPYHYFSQPKYV